MSFVTIGAIAGATTAAVSIGGKVAQGVAAQGVDSQGAVDSAANLSMAERVQMGNENKLQLNKISMKSKSMMDSATTKGRGSMMEVFKT